jgi:microcompartment protein CcmL/EutN
VLRIDVSSTNGEIRYILAKERGCKTEDVQLAGVRCARNGLGYLWMRGPAGAVRKVTQAGKVAIGWSIATVNAIGRRPLQCFRWLEIGNMRKTCTSKENKGHLCYMCGGSRH